MGWELRCSRCPSSEYFERPLAKRSPRGEHHARLNPAVLLALPLNPQCSHSNHWRTASHFQFHVSFPHCGHVSACDGFGATNEDCGTEPRTRPAPFKAEHEARDGVRSPGWVRTPVAPLSQYGPCRSRQNPSLFEPIAARSDCEALFRGRGACDRSLTEGLERFRFTAREDERPRSWRARSARGWQHMSLSHSLARPRSECHAGGHQPRAAHPPKDGAVLLRRGPPLQGRTPPIRKEDLRARATLLPSRGRSLRIASGGLRLPRTRPLHETDIDGSDPRSWGSR